MKDTIECKVCHGIVNPDNPTTYHNHMSNEIPTPRTDAAEFEHREYGDWGAPDIHHYCTADFARQLERELHEVREANKSVSDAYLRVRKLVNAFDTNYAGENRFEITEQAIKKIQSQLHQWQEVAEKLAKCLNTAVAEWQGQGEKLTWQDTAKALTAFNQLKEQEKT